VRKFGRTFVKGGEKSISIPTLGWRRKKRGLKKGLVQADLLWGMGTSKRGLLILSGERKEPGENGCLISRFSTGQSLAKKDNAL